MTRPPTPERAVPATTTRKRFGSNWMRKARQSAAGQPVSVAPVATVTARPVAPEPVGTAN